MITLEENENVQDEQEERLSALDSYVNFYFIFIFIPPSKIASNRLRAGT